MKLAMGQMSMNNNINENYEKTLQMMKKAQDADFLFFPEIQWTPFFPQYSEGKLQGKIGLKKDDLCLELNDKRIQSLQEKCKEYEIYLSPNLYIKQNGKNYDMSLMIDSKGGLLGVSKMVHICQADQFFEQDYYEPSEDGFKIYDTPFGKIGVVICFDRHLPESIRTCAKKGAELIIIPTANTITEPLEMFEWELRVQAYQNNIFIAMCNRVGVEGNMEFAGESIIIDSDGNVVFKAGSEESLIIKEIDLSKVKESRKKRPYINFIRPESYI